MISVEQLKECQLFLLRKNELLQQHEKWIASIRGKYAASCTNFSGWWGFSFVPLSCSLPMTTELRTLVFTNTNRSQPLIRKRAKLSRNIICLSRPSINRLTVVIRRDYVHNATHLVSENTCLIMDHRRGEVFYKNTCK